MGELGFIERDVDLTSRNTLALPGRAACFAEIRSIDSLVFLQRDADIRKLKRFVLGGGSNLVLGGDFDGLVLHMAISGRELLTEDGEAWYVRAGAGENWNDFVQWTLGEGWPGLENLSLIPGTVGAAPIQNIGAYGLECCERFQSLNAFDMLTGKLVVFDCAACCFGYRDSVFKREGWYRDGRYVITDVTFRLPKRWQALTRYNDVSAELESRQIVTPNARDIADAVIAVRRRKLPDPAVVPNTGSFFQNPVVDAATARTLSTSNPGLPSYLQLDGSVKLAAGWLIEQAGWKGRNLGPAGMYEKQALVLVNRGGANGRDVQALMQAVQVDVHAKFGVRLLPEPVFL